MSRIKQHGKTFVIGGLAAATLAVGAVAYTSTLESSTAETAGLVSANTRINPGPPAAVPAALNPPAGLHPIGSFVVTSGTQTYTCVNGSFAGASVPEAQLAGRGGLIHHFGGPSWQSVKDGSLVTAGKTAESAVPGAIPQLLLTVKTHSGPANGMLSRVENIQRLNTSGGTAPTRACTDGETTAVPYRAVYVFWAR
jgi:hypothetical protein